MILGKTEVGQQLTGNETKKDIGGNVVNITNAIIDAKNISMQQIIKNIDKGMIKFISNEILIVRVVNFRYMGRFYPGKATNSGKPQPFNRDSLKTFGSILGHVRLLRAMDNLDPDEDKTMNRLKKSMNDQANAVLQDQDNLMMGKIMNLTKNFEANATNRGKLEIRL